ncbi:DUF3558 domain-containing protein [Streptoalloteichus hindustanus]|nr:DUF3558 domain-containing protein [Streptoalloteichus hindustanus]
MACAWALAACGVSATGVPRAVTSAPTTSAAGGDGSSTTNAPSSGGGKLAPRVAQPKNLRGLDPCEQLLTPQQRAELTFTKAGEKLPPSHGMEGCQLFSSDLGIIFTVNANRDGLEEAYRNRKRITGFREVQVDGYPGIRSAPSELSCRLLLGVADDQDLAIDFTRVGSRKPEHRDPCAFTETIARMVLPNLPEGR